MSLQKMVKQMVETMNMPKGTEPYDTTAEVVRVDGDTAWVHISGGVDETPVKLTINAVKGDRVQIRVGGGTAWIVGNESKPPTDDRVANVAQKTAENADLKAILAKKTADNASKVATNYIDFTKEEGLTVGYKDLNSKVNISGGGVKLYDEDGNVGTEIKSGFVQVGRNDDGHTTIQEDGMDIYGGDGTELLAHIGYDDGNALSGTATAPFYTFGTRASGEIGNYSLAEGKRVIAKGYCSHAEGIDTKANTRYSHAEGSNTTADGVASHAEGVDTIAEGTASHAEGKGTKAKGQHSHAEGWEAKANNLCSHAEGLRTTASSDYQHVQGKYNVDDPNSTYADIVGWGSTDTSRKNIFALSTGGDGRYNGDVYVGCNANSTGGRKVTSQAQGQVLTVSGVTSQSYKDYAVTFPTPYASTPLVVAGLAGTLTAYGMGMVSVAVNNVTTTGFTARVYNASSNNRNVTFRYIAIAP